MKIKVIAPPFCDQTFLDDRGEAELPGQTRLSSLLGKMKIPPYFRPLLIIRVNYDKVPRNYILNDGDIVSLFWPISGG
ncbi:MAG: MoaD/ThiS family protein [Spirochaetales bacterium]|nr:MoaD/ThiS family protein [Spirochaetales bacterium]